MAQTAAPVLPADTPPRSLGPRSLGSRSLGSRSLGRQPVLAVVVILFCLSQMLLIALENPQLGGAAGLVEFDVFYIIGLLAQQGRLAEAYHLPALVAAYREFSGQDSFMPWTYPPQFNLIAALLPLAPRGLAYLLFTGLSFLGFVWVLHRLAGAWLPAVLAMSLPVLYVQLASGQNGFLTAALAGWMCLWLAERRQGAGLPLGLLVIKPHMGLGLGLWALARGDWRLLAQALGVVLASSVLATLLFGPEVWLAFRAGVAEAGGFLAEGLYPFYRMTSLYAGLHRLGVDPGLALGLQLGLAALAAAAVVVVARRGGVPLRHGLALACVATLLFSPYTYDYDLTLGAVALALVARDLFARATRGQAAALVALVWMAGGWGLLRVLLALAGIAGDLDLLTSQALSAGFPFLLAAILLAARILARPDPGTLRA